MDNPSPPNGGSALTRRSLLRRAALTTAGVALGGVGINELAPLAAPERIGVDENASHWARALPEPGSPLERALDVDVVIVGAGLTGLSTAYHLRQLLPGRQVAVLEARRCGNGASARNGGMLLPSTGDRYLVPGTDAALDRRVHALTLENFALLRQLQAELGLDAELDPDGALHALRSPDDARRGATDASRLRDRGIAVEYWNREQTAAAIGTSAYAGALFDPSAGHVHPGKLVALWKRAAELSGARIYEGTTVTSIEEGAIHTLTTAAGARVRAPVLVLATNAYGTQLGYLRRAIAPVWSHVGITPPLTDAQLAALGWRARAPFDDDRTELFYLGRTRDGRVHIGGGRVDYSFNDAAPSAAIRSTRYQALHAELARLYPPLREVPFETAWSGAVDMSIDAAPALGRMGRAHNVYYAIGYSGHGVNLSSVFGRVLADLIAGAGAAWAWLPYLGRTPPYLPNEPFRWLSIRARLAAIRAAE